MIGRFSEECLWRCAIISAEKGVWEVTVIVFAAGKIKLVSQIFSAILGVKNCVLERKFNKRCQNGWFDPQNGRKYFWKLFAS